MVAKAPSTDSSTTPWVPPRRASALSIATDVGKIPCQSDPERNANGVRNGKKSRPGSTVAPGYGRATEVQPLASSASPCSSFTAASTESRVAGSSRASATNPWTTATAPAAAHVRQRGGGGDGWACASTGDSLP